MRVWLITTILSASVALPAAYTSPQGTAFPGVRKPRTLPYIAGTHVGYPKLEQRVDPVYPADALDGRVEGIVDLEIGINEEGQVWYANETSGHPLLMDAALQAVRHWRYRPSYIDGSPVPVGHRDSINFVLPSSLVPDRHRSAAAPPKSRPIRLSTAVLESRLLISVEPIYPPEALAAGLRGVVVLRILLNEAGEVFEANPERGHPILVAAAIQSVLQRRYASLTFRGAPAATEGMVIFVFEAPDPPRP